MNFKSFKSIYFPYCLCPRFLSWRQWLLLTSWTSETTCPQPRASRAFRSTSTFTYSLFWILGKFYSWSLHIIHFRSSDLILFWSLSIFLQFRLLENKIGIKTEHRVRYNQSNYRRWGRDKTLHSTLLAVISLFNWPIQIIHPSTCWFLSNHV